MDSSGFWKPAPAWQDSSLQLRDDHSAGGRYYDDDAVIPPSFWPNRTPLAQQRLLLPIYKHKKQISYAVEEYNVVVIVGETGCGKSTQIPSFLLSAGWAEKGFQIVCTQPRRIAAITLAQRVSEELGTQLGSRVGYCVRFDDKTSPQTQIKYVTDGILLREATLADPLLSSYSVVMVDEAHERSLQTDALLGLLKRIRRKRKGLRLIICSATIDAQQFLNFFVGKSSGSSVITVPLSSEESRSTIHQMNSSSRTIHPNEDKGTIISVDGRQYPVDVLFVAQPVRDYVQSMVETAWNIHQREGEGDILGFLPTAEDIDNAIRLTEEHFQGAHTVQLLPLYGSLPFQMQSRIFQTDSNRNRRTHRRVIFATNIAETSVTVPGITFVIDSGLVKLPYFDSRTGFERLIVSSISQASARQRAGRAGRVNAGKCFRLYTETFMTEKMPSQTTPEILRSNLMSFILTLKALGVDNVLAFDLIEIPSVESMSYALELLYALGAIDDKTNLSKLGMQMSVFPTTPAVSRMLLESLDVGCSWEALAVAATLQVRDLYIKPRKGRPQQLLDYHSAVAEVADPSGDHVTYVNLLSEAEDRGMDEAECREKFVNFLALRRAVEVRNQLAGFLKQFGRVQALGSGSPEERSRIIRRCVTAGFFFNVAKLDNDGQYRTLRNQIVVSPTSNSIYATHATISSEYIVFSETLDGPRGGIELRAVSAIEAKWLHELAPHYWE